MILPKYAFRHSQKLFDVVGAVGNSMILPKYAFRHSQKLYDIVKVCLWGGRELHDIAKVCLQTQPETV